MGPPLVSREDQQYVNTQVLGVCGGWVCVCRVCVQEGSEVADMAFAVEGFPPGHCCAPYPVGSSQIPRSFDPLRGPLVPATNGRGCGESPQMPPVPAPACRGLLVLAARLTLRVGGPPHRALSLGALWGRRPIDADSVASRLQPPRPCPPGAPEEGSREENTGVGLGRGLSPVVGRGSKNVPQKPDRRP